MMQLTLHRQPSADGATLGELLLDGRHECWTLEDVVRPAGEPKVYGQTAIPAGRYRVIVTFSNRFQVLMPLLVAVPGFEGVRIHPGNTAADTDGCVLVGRTKGGNTVGSSRLAYDALFPRIVAGYSVGDVWIDVLDAAAEQPLQVAPPIPVHAIGDREPQA